MVCPTSDNNPPQKRRRRNALLPNSGTIPDLNVLTCMTYRERIVFTTNR